jgi:hypothetical protein
VVIYALPYTKMGIFFLDKIMVIDILMVSEIKTMGLKFGVIFVVCKHVGGITKKRLLKRGTHGMKLHNILHCKPEKSGNNWKIDGVIYTPSEGYKMSRLEDKEKMNVHLIKKVFQGVMV